MTPLLRPFSTPLPDLRILPALSALPLAPPPPPFLLFLPSQLDAAGCSPELIMCAANALADTNHARGRRRPSLFCWPCEAEAGGVALKLRWYLRLPHKIPSFCTVALQPDDGSPCSDKVAGSGYRALKVRRLCMSTDLTFFWLSLWFCMWLVVVGDLTPGVSSGSYLRGQANGS